MVIPQQSVYSGPTAGVQLVNRPGGLHLVVFTATSAAATCSIYDNTAATGNPILTLAAGVNTTVYPTADGFSFNVGLFAVVTGAGASLTAFYE